MVNGDVIQNEIRNDQKCTMVALHWFSLSQSSSPAAKKARRCCVISPSKIIQTSSCPESLLKPSESHRPSRPSPSKLSDFQDGTSWNVAYMWPTCLLMPLTGNFPIVWGCKVNFSGSMLDQFDHFMHGNVCQT